MSTIAPRRSARRCLLLALAALAVVVLFVAADVRLHWTGLTRDVFWAAGIGLYASLLGAASGPVTDYRDRSRTETPGTDARPDRATGLGRR